MNVQLNRNDSNAAQSVLVTFPPDMPMDCGIALTMTNSVGEFYTETMDYTDDSYLAKIVLAQGATTVNEGQQLTLNAVAEDQPNGSGTLTRRLYAEQDADYNVTSITDSSGNVVERYSYDPYGNVTVENADGTTRGTGTASASSYSWNVLHQGLMLDSGTGTYDDRNREYNPTLGRFLQQDPAGYVDGLNAYQYQLSNVLYAADPTGLDVVVAPELLPSSQMAEETGPAGMAASVGIGLGAGIYYSGAGKYLGTDWLGDKLGDWWAGGSPYFPPNVKRRNKPAKAPTASPAGTPALTGPKKPNGNQAAAPPCPKNAGGGKVPPLPPPVAASPADPDDEARRILENAPKGNSTVTVFQDIADAMQDQWMDSDTDQLQTQFGRDGSPVGEYNPRTGNSVTWTHTDAGTPETHINLRSGDYNIHVIVK